MHRMIWLVAVLVALLPFLAVTSFRPPEAAPHAVAAPGAAVMKAAPPAIVAAGGASVTAAPPTNIAQASIAAVKASPRAAVAIDDAAVRTEPSSDAQVVDTLDPGDVIPVVGTVEGEHVSGGSGVWLKTADGHYVYSGVAKMQQDGSKYIDVDKRRHTALAIDKGTIVYSAPVVLGRPGWPTPVGQFTITDRVSKETMDSTVLGIPVDSPAGFSYPNVRYVQYVDGGFALHTNYWAPSSAFGQADSSHGCVGMELADAKFFWDFADVGTPVYIHD